MTVIYTYMAYLAISIAMTIWVAQTLHKNGAAFLTNAFEGDSALSHSVNHLLVVGFYLINLGFVCFHLTMSRKPGNATEAIELLSGKLGVVLLVLGAMHFGNIFIFSKFRKTGLARRLLPPVVPDQRVHANAG